MPTTVFVSTNRTDDRVCPVCHRVLDAATAMSTDPNDPQPRLRVDDITCCAYCRTILRVTTLGFRPATEAEIDALGEPLRSVLFEYMQQHQKGAQ